MLERIVQDQVADLLARQAEWRGELAQDFDFAALEAKVGEAVNRLGAELLKAALSALLMAPEFIRALKNLGALGDAAQGLPFGEGAFWQWAIGRGGGPVLCESRTEGSAPCSASRKLSRLGGIGISAPLQPSVG